MKTKKLNIAVPISILLFIAGCESDHDFTSCADCETSTFKQTYLRYFQDDEVFLIKGVALDVAKHGREIKVVEDMKGNFSGKSSVFVWGAGSTSSCDDQGRQDMRIDNITQYHENDTLIMLITNKVLKQFNWDIERPNDYKTLGCCYSILKLSDGYVTGNMDYWQNKVPWEELQEELEELQTLLNAEIKPSWWRSEKYLPVPFIIACKGALQPRNPDYYFFIQGLVSGVSDPDYGKQIQIITDLKGNFPEGTATISVWGTNGSRSDIFDDLRLYHHQDTLLMLLLPVRIFSNNTEKQGYTTIPFSFSVLKLSKNHVSGYITSCYKEEETMSREEFQTLLNSIK
jgi:hypothetical protein